MSPPRSQADHERDLVLATKIGEFTAELKGLRGDMKDVKSSLKNGSDEFAALNGRVAACEAKIAVIQAQADARSKARYWWLAAALSLWSTFVAALLAFLTKWFTTNPTPPAH